MASDQGLNRREFLGVAAGAALAGTAPHALARNESRHPNLLFVFADQWRAQATGYLGDPNVCTPNLDALAKRGVNLVNAVSGCPVCSPYRGTLMTGQYPLTHGVFMNDVYLRPESVSFAEALNAAGYQTGYIGKWHLDGHGRSAFIPPERRQGFGYWKVLECTHEYNNSKYYADADELQVWDGYDAIAQTDDAIRFLREDRDGRPFALFLSWGPPHNPYETAPQRYRAMYDPATLELRPNVPPEAEDQARRDLAGYYAHCTALDDCMGRLLAALEEMDLTGDTLVVFTSDHGDMLGSQGQQRKQRPYDESIRVPLIFHCPPLLGKRGRALEHPVSSVDLMPTVLGLCGVPVPETVEGRDLSRYLRGGRKPEQPALLACYIPFGEWLRSGGGKEYRGIRTERYTYVRDLEGPWLLYDNEQDPYQQLNLISDAEHAGLQARLDAMLDDRLEAAGDEFLPGNAYVERWGYVLDHTGTVPYTP
jgi:arylsulfatase A-like enzyme